MNNHFHLFNRTCNFFSSPDVVPLLSAWEYAKKYPFPNVAHLVLIIQDANLHHYSKLANQLYRSLPRELDLMAVRSRASMHCPKLRNAQMHGGFSFAREMCVRPRLKMIHVWRADYHSQYAIIARLPNALYSIKYHIQISKAFFKICSVTDIQITLLASYS